MKIKEIRTIADEELNVKLGELRKELIKLNAQLSTGTTPKSPGQIRQIKRTIAKILTVKKSKKSEVKKKDE